jgi:hypothetical protein
LRFPRHRRDGVSYQLLDDGIFDSSQPGTLSHNDLFKDGFPYTHTWTTSQAHDPQIFVARAKPGNVKAKLKRALGDDTSEQAAKKQK